MAKEQMYVVKFKYTDDRDNKEYQVAGEYSYEKAEHLKDRLNARFGELEEYWVEPAK